MIATIEKSTKKAVGPKPTAPQARPLAVVQSAAERADYAPEMTDDTQLELTMRVCRATSISVVLAHTFSHDTAPDPAQLEGITGTVAYLHRCVAGALSLLEGITNLPDELQSGLTEGQGVLEMLLTNVEAADGWHLASDVYTGYFDAVDECMDRARSGLDQLLGQSEKSA